MFDDLKKAERSSSDSVRDSGGSDEIKIFLAREFRWVIIVEDLGKRSCVCHSLLGVLLLSGKV
jgi:hypothetical protein